MIIMLCRFSEVGRDNYILGLGEVVLVLIHVAMFSLYRKNHDDDHILERTDLPDKLIKKATGVIAFEEEAQLVRKNSSEYYSI